MTSIIEAIQTYYGTLTAWTGQPPILWPGIVLEKNPDNTAVAYPFIRITDRQVSGTFTFEFPGLETWQWAVDVFAETRQDAILHLDHILYNGSPPTARAGFFYPDAITLPTNYSFLSLGPVGGWVCAPVQGQFTGLVSPLHQLNFTLELICQRTAF